MSEPPTGHLESQAGRMLLRFNDEGGRLHDLNAAEFADVLRGVVEFTGQMASAGLFGERIAPTVRVRPPEPGSFIVDFVIQFAQEDPEAALGTALAAGGALGQSIRVAVRRLRGTEVKDFERLENGNVKLIWPDDTTDEVPPRVWDELRTQKRKTKKALHQIMAPLSDDVTTVEVRGSTSSDVDAPVDEAVEAAPDVVLDRADYRIAAPTADEDPDDEQEDEFEIEATMKTIDFRPDARWTIEVKQGRSTRTRSVRIEDSEFLAAIEAGRALRKSDILSVRVHEVLTVRNGRATRDWTIVKVISQRRGVGDEGGEESPGGTSS